MKLTQLQNEIKTKIVRGRYFSITYTKNINGYEKTTKTVVTLKGYHGNYQCSNPNENYLGDNIIENTKTGVTRLMVFVTQNPKQKPHSTCNYYGNEISVEEWYEKTHRKHTIPDTMFSIDISDIVELHQKHKGA